MSNYANMFKLMRGALLPSPRLPTLVSFVIRSWKAVNGYVRTLTGDMQADLVFSAVRA